MSKKVKKFSKISEYFKKKFLFIFLDPKLKIIKCNIFDQTDLAKHLANVDAVVSCLGGFPKNPETKMTDGYSKSIGPITEAMRAQNITRILVLGSWYSNNNGSDAVTGFGGYYFVRKELFSSLISIFRDFFFQILSAAFWKT